jgi:hypothetical protein
MERIRITSPDRLPNYSILLTATSDEDGFRIAAAADRMR